MSMKFLRYYLFLIYFHSTFLGAAFYQDTNGVLIGPIQDIDGNAHPYSGPDLLPNVVLPSIDLTEAVLSDADLQSSDLNQSILSDVLLQEANLSTSNFNEVDFWNINLFLSNSNNSYFYQADFSLGELSFADFSMSNLSGADFWYAILWYTNFSNANLSGSEFWFADLWFADLSNADLTNIDFWQTDLSNANFQGANLSGSYLDLALNWNSADFTNATYNNDTLFPTGFDPETEGMIFDAFVPFPTGIYFFLAGLFCFSFEEKGNQIKDRK